MARATKGAKRSKGSGKKAATGGLSGVSHDEHGPVYEEDLSTEQREIRSEALLNLMAQLEQKEATWKDHAAGHRAEVKDLKAEIHDLAESLRTGKVKRSAQGDLPGTEATA